MVLFDVEVTAMFENQELTDDSSVNVSGRVSGLLMLGFMLIFVGIIVLIVVALLNGGSDSSSVNGVVIFIGPFPIVFGAGFNSNWLMIIGIIITITLFSLFAISSWRARKVMG
ncbi:MAG: DUF131 domain-containing protein [Candidatus Bathyarchaeota archaeon]|nr:DUF131 domain-containing protein [Candidatus Termiticorpusculum sp.]